MRKRDVLFRDAELHNRVGGGTRHEGLEADLGLQLLGPLSMELTASLARHRYDRDFLPGQCQPQGTGRGYCATPFRGDAAALAGPDRLGSGAGVSLDRRLFPGTRETAAAIRGTNC